MNETERIQKKRELVLAYQKKMEAYFRTCSVNRETSERLIREAEELMEQINELNETNTNYLD